MTYLSLYRRCRPLTFGDMTGQEHITRTLSNALESDRLAHAYLFCGPRGTGKTTAAKIFARAMNCEKYPTAEPCGKCKPCLNIAAGVSIDVIEMDAASNRGIDEIRELREKSRFASGESRYKIYIIDEAHMLTPEACNAFLKTLEEPPRSVVFILATTDPSRLPSTIVSRCQRFDFHLLTVDQIRLRLENILGRENWQAEKEAVDLIARLADGSLRDALGILEQCAAYGEDQITADHVRAVTGATRTETIEALLKAVIENSFDAGLSVLEEVIYSGCDLNLFLRDLTFVFSRLLLESSSAKKATTAGRNNLEEVAAAYHGRIDKNTLMDAVELLHGVNSELRHAHFPQYILEVAFIRLLRLLHGSKPLASPAGREEQLKPPLQKKPAPAVTQTDLSSSSHDQVSPASAEKESSPDDRSGVKDDLSSKIKEAWPRLLQEIKRQQKSTAAWLEPAVLGQCQGNLVRLVYNIEYSIHQLRIMEESHRKIVEEVISSFCGKPVKVKAVIGEEQGLSRQTPETTENAPKESSGQNNNKARKNTDDALEIFGGRLIDSD